jgi:hypothetical protein
MYLVTEEFNPKKDYGIKIRAQYAKCLASLKKDAKINPHDFVKAHLNEFTSKPQSFKSNRTLIYHSFTIGKKIGMLRVLTQEETGYSISYENFCKLKTVSEFIAQHRKSAYKNLPPKKNKSTAGSYSWRLWKFNEWLHGKTFEFQRLVQKSETSFERIKETITLTDVEHFLELYKDAQKPQEFIAIIKLYLRDPIHEGKRDKTIKIDKSAIQSYFEKSEYPITFTFNPSVNYKTTDDDDEQPIMTLVDVMNLLTIGKPTMTQKAVFMCKLQRGLDNSTFADRFNFVVWKQLVEYFGTDNYTQWDLKKCPAPIRLTRVKTGVGHDGFLDLDAIKAIQDYLEYRRKHKENPMLGGALFLNDRNQPITEEWIQTSFRKLRKNAGLDKELSSYKLQKRYRVTSHEFRDLLKSTLIDAGTRLDLADHFIGHKRKDTYEKQPELYPETLRKEYCKASKLLNIFSNFASFVKGGQSNDEMKERMSKVESELSKVFKHHDRTKNLKRKRQKN